MTKKTITEFFRSLKIKITRNKIGDRLTWLMRFVQVHKRLPSNKLLFNDVLYKIKTTDEILDPLRVFVSDKEFVKVYIKSTVGDQYNVPTIAILKKNNEVDNYDFPQACCIKPTHASGLFIFRKNGEKIDKNQIKKWFSLNYYTISRERNYKFLKPKIIIEPIIFDGVNLYDYKFFCYKGKVRLIQFDLNRFTDHRRAIFDKNWNIQDFTISYPKPEQHTVIERPKNLEKMIQVAESLSSNFGFVRVDLYSNGEKCLVGEITNCHGSGEERFIPYESEKKFSHLFFS
jgi:hypothetical protein